MYASHSRGDTSVASVGAVGADTVAYYRGRGLRTRSGQVGDRDNFRAAGAALAAAVHFMVAALRRDREPRTVPASPRPRVRLLGPVSI